MEKGTRSLTLQLARPRSGPSLCCAVWQNGHVWGRWQACGRGNVRWTATDLS